MDLQDRINQYDMYDFWERSPRGKWCSAYSSGSFSEMRGRANVSACICAVTGRKAGEPKPQEPESLRILHRA